MQAGSQDAHRQVMHMLYVAAHATTVALSGYVTDLQTRLEVGARRRQPLAERPTAPSRSIGSNPDGQSGAEGRTAHSLTADSISSPQLLTMAGA